LAALLGVALAGNTADWKKRTVYQVLTDRFYYPGASSACSNLSKYCGGTFKGLEEKLDYITGMGFDAIWISPVVTNYENGYHGYWATNWNTINSHFGTADELKQLVSTAHSKGVWVMVDVVANHVGPVGDDFSEVYPLNTASDYHTDCQIVNWSDQAQVEYCRLADLPDLDQDNSYVRQFLKDWIKDLVQTYNFDGIRIDTIPEVSKDFWSEFGASSGVFQMGECFNGDPAYVGGYQGAVTALFNYPMYYTIKDVFLSKKSAYNIRDRFNTEANYFSDIDALGIFVDNHDNARFLNSGFDVTGFKNALVFAMHARGIPFVYYGSEQAYAGGNDPQNRESLWQDMNTGYELYSFMRSNVNARKTNQNWNYSQVERYINDNFYAFS
jgi:alpha-amylase